MRGTRATRPRLASVTRRSSLFGAPRRRSRRLRRPPTLATPAPSSPPRTTTRRDPPSSSTRPRVSCRRTPHRSRRSPSSRPRSLDRGRRCGRHDSEEHASPSHPVIASEALVTVHAVTRVTNRVVRALGNQVSGPGVPVSGRGARWLANVTRTYASDDFRATSRGRSDESDPPGHLDGAKERRSAPPRVSCDATSETGLSFCRTRGGGARACQEDGTANVVDVEAWLVRIGASFEWGRAKNRTVPTSPRSFASNAPATVGLFVTTFPSQRRTGTRPVRAGTRERCGRTWVAPTGTKLEARGCSLVRGRCLPRAKGTWPVRGRTTNETERARLVVVVTRLVGRRCFFVPA